MKIALGSDHRGHGVKQRLADVLAKAGHEIVDFGVASGDEGVDYPDFAIPVCGTGFGMCIAANKVHGIRAVTCRNDIEAEMSRRHNDANVLCMSADFLGQEQIDRMVGIWLKTEFDSGRHLRRVEKIKKYEQDHSAD